MEKRKILTTILSILGFVLAYLPFAKYLKLQIVAGTITKESISFNFTGVDGTILTIGIVLLFFAYFIYHKKLPWFK